jgi:ComF family protein
MKIKTIANRLINLIYPNVCEICGCTLVNGEETLCLNCLYQMPRTNAHLDDFNMIHKRLSSTTPIEHAAGYFYYFRESPYAGLIHSAKYRNRPEIARRLARRFAHELKRDSFFGDIDMLLPVPLHLFKQWSRGYNQSHQIALGINDITGIEIGSHLYARRHHATQTRRGAFDRWINAQYVYSVRNPGQLHNRHVLIVDDVITTGATLLACCNAVHSAQPTCKISVLSLGVTHLL